MARMKLREPPPKTEQFVMRLAEEDKGMLAELADKRKSTAAEVVRSLIRREHGRIFGKE